MAGGEVGRRWHEALEERELEGREGPRTRASCWGSLLCPLPYISPAALAPISFSTEPPSSLEVPSKPI